MNSELAASLLVALIIGITVVSLSIRTTLLRDQSDAAQKPYSFSRVQLAWWTAIIGICLILKFGFTGHTDVLTPGCLALLGISALTTGSAKIIDDRDTAAAAAAPLIASRHQNAPGESFFTDILSDDQGPSVHRLQALVFNFLFGVIFLAKFFSEVTAAQLPDFGPTELGLMGLSSATYVALKAGEN